MNNIRIIKNGIDVHRVCEQLSIYSDDWYIQREGTDTLLERGYADIEVGNLQLIMGAVKKKKDFVGDSELSKPTPAYGRHTEVLRIIEKEMPGIAGQYQYFVGNETVIVDPGTLLWFNNKMPHGTVNLGDETRITFVFDMPHES